MRCFAGSRTLLASGTSLRVQEARRMSRAVSRKCVDDRRRPLGIETSQRTHQIPCPPGRSSRWSKSYIVVLPPYGKPEMAVEESCRVPRD